MKTDIQVRTAAMTVLAAAFLWFAVFLFHGVKFWDEISLTVLMLAGTALYRNRKNLKREKIRLRYLAVGFCSAALLYLLFHFGTAAARGVLPGVRDSLLAVYGLKDGEDLRKIGMLLLCIIGPGEEIFWRGYIQNTLSLRFGGAKACLLTATAYSGFYIMTGNPALIAAAMAGGLFWGWMYEKEKSVWPVMFSHALWNAAIFMAYPLI